MTRHARQTARALSRPIVAALVVLLLLAAGFAAAAWWPDGKPTSAQEPGTGLGATQSAPRPTPTPTPTPTPEPDAVFTILAAGDVLPHAPVLQSARVDGGYDFSPLLAGVNAWVAGADLALCHMEVPVSPDGQQPSGYPTFGTVPQVVTDLKEQGWDGCSTASNHSVDRAYAGVVKTLDTFDAAGLGHVGTARSAAEAAQPQLYQLEREGRTITVAQLSAAYGLNGLPVPADEPWAVNLIDVDALIAQAVAARGAGADLVVASIHDGVEYTSDPTPEQVDIATRLAASGEIDLMIGHHAHVPQPIAKLPGGPDGKGMWVAYGLGNFVSNQDSDCCSPKTDSGLFFTATVTAPADEPARVTGVDWTAITVDRLGGHRVHAIKDVLATGSETLSPAQLQERYDRVLAAVGTQAPERTTPPVPTGDPAVVVPRQGVPAP